MLLNATDCLACEVHVALDRRDERREELMQRGDHFGYWVSCLDDGARDASLPNERENDLSVEVSSLPIVDELLRLNDHSDLDCGETCT